MENWIFKILRPDEWANCKNNDCYAGAPIDISDGYIHFSTLDQLQDTADKHFSGEQTIHIAAFSSATWPHTLKWEPSRGDQLFPHLYGPLDMTLVAKNWQLEKKPDGTFDISAVTLWAQNHD